MNHRREYEIAFVGLKPGLHEFEYQADDKFFAMYGEQDFTNAKAVVKLKLDKHAGFLMLKFDVGGSVDVSCDRCGNNLTMQLWDEFNLMVKMVDNPEQMNEQEEDPDVYYISRTESHLSVADWIYEFVNLSLPMQKMCPEYEAGETKCNKEVLEKLRKMEDDARNSTSSIWKELDKFKDLEQ